MLRAVQPKYSHLISVTNTRDYKQTFQSDSEGDDLKQFASHLKEKYQPLELMMKMSRLKTNTLKLWDKMERV